MSLTSVINDKSRLRSSEDENDWPLQQRILTNQDVSMYYMRRKEQKQVKLVPDEDGIIQKSVVKQFEGNFYRTYSFLDLLNLVHVRNLLRRREQFFIHDETMLSVYEGHTFFSIFENNPEVFEQVYEQLSSRTFEDSVDFNKQTTESLFLRRLYKILSIPVVQNQLIFEDENCTGNEG